MLKNCKTDLHASKFMRKGDTKLAPLFELTRINLRLAIKPMTERYVARDNSDYSSQPTLGRLAQCAVALPTSHFR